MLITGSCWSSPDAVYLYYSVFCLTAWRWALLCVQHVWKKTKWRYIFVEQSPARAAVPMGWTVPRNCMVSDELNVSRLSRRKNSTYTAWIFMAVGHSPCIERLPSMNTFTVVFFSTKLSIKTTDFSQRKYISFLSILLDYGLILYHFAYPNDVIQTGAQNVLFGRIEVSKLIVKSCFVLLFLFFYLFIYLFF